jgi:sarcosine oxidase subunit alpha
MNPRLQAQEGEWIDRGQPISFQFEGQTYGGFRGDVIASALWANGVRMTGRSFKYHRARGIYSLAGHDTNALFTDGSRTNLRGDGVSLAPDMRLHAVNTFGGLRRDRMRIVEKFSRLMPVGFYYKTFFRPRWLFPFHDRQIRKVAGLGRINPGLPPTSSAKDYAWCDVLVVGAGPAGLSAARAAGQAGLRVMLVEEQARLGGSLVWQHGRDPGARVLLREHAEALKRMPNVEIRTGTTVGAHFADHWVALFDAVRMTKLRAGSVVYANGAVEQPAVFGQNDLPGVLLASAAQRMIRLYAIRPFDRVVVLAANSDAYAATLDMLEAGVQVAAVADLRTEGEESPLASQVSAKGVPIRNGHTVYEAIANPDRTGVAGAVICPLDAQGEADPSRPASLACDGVAVSVGWTPNASLLGQAGVRFSYDDRLHQLLPVAMPDGVYAAGRANGVYELSGQMADGRRAALTAAKFLGRPAEEPAPVPRHAGSAPSHPYPIFAHPAHKNFVDMDEDIHATDIANARQEGFDSVELLKRYSTLGMGPSQGKLANVNAIRILAKLNGRTINETGTTTARPFYTPVPIGHLAGRRFHPMRHTPIHGWHEANGAVFMHAGEWFRPEYYRRHGESREESVLAEARQVRTGVGMIDVGTLGKFFVQGPDAAEFLERIYTGRFENLAVGKTRYGVAVDESGVVIEDGVVGRLAEDRFYVTATSSGAGVMYREMHRWALIWSMNVTLVNATGHFAAVNVAGPRSREVLRGLVNVGLGPEEFPFLGVREGRFGDIPVIMMRVGFVGEWGYEIHVPAWHSAHVWQAIHKSAQPFGVRPFGVEAQRLLRLEKGHPIITLDTDAVTTPFEAGLGWAIAKNKPFFVGQRSLQIIARQPLTRKLVGIRWPEGHRGPLPEECHLVVRDGRLAGRVTSIASRSTLGFPLGMAFVEPDLGEPGTVLTIRLSDGTICKADVAKLPFYDPEGLRQKAL